MPDDEPLPRPGTGADLSRRMDRLEQNHEQLTREFAVLTNTVNRVELNQQHAEELNRLQFAALNTGLHALSSDLKGFMVRMEGLVSGEVQTPVSRASAELVADYQRWRQTVEDRFDESDNFTTQLRTSARVLLVVLGTGWLGTAIALVAVWRTFA